MRIALTSVGIACLPLSLNILLLVVPLSILYGARYHLLIRLIDVLKSLLKRQVPYVTLTKFRHSKFQDLLYIYEYCSSLTILFIGLLNGTIVPVPPVPYDQKH